MASASSGELPDKRDERRKQLMLGDLPPDFLRVLPISEEQQLELDEQAALALQQQLGGNFGPATVSGRLSISIIEAKLTKNYGMTRMDPYVRLRVGQTVYETPTDYNGAKNPHWNKVFHCFLIPSIVSIYIEVFDECAFTLDEKVAWAHYQIPESVYHGETLDEWVPLTGRQGEEKEGFINLVLSYTPIPSGTVIYPPQQMLAWMPAPFYGVTAVPYCAPVCNPQVAAQPPAPGAVVQPQPTPQQQPVQITDDDIKQIKEMFPNVEENVIKTVLEGNNGNKDHTINALLAMSTDS